MKRTIEIKSGTVTTTVPWDLENSYNNVMGKGRITSEQDAYSRVPLIFRALRMRCNSLIRIPVHIYEGSPKDKKDRKEIDSYIFEDSLKFKDFLWLSEASLLLRGAAYILKLKNQYQLQGRVNGEKGLQWLNPYTMQSIYENQQLLLWQQLFTGERFPLTGGYWLEDDLIYIREFSPTTDVFPGVSATQVALGGAQISNNVTQFLSNFFGADAIPVTMITMDKNTGDPERKRVENWFRERLDAFRRVVGARVLGVTNDIKIEKLTPELKSFEFEKIDTHAEDSVSYAFDIPKSVLTGSGANRAETEAHYRSFLDTTVIPRARMFENYINPVLEQYNQYVEFDAEEMPEYQLEETARAASVKSLVDSGMPLDAALVVLGYELSDEVKKIMEADKKDKALQKKNQPSNTVIDGNGNVMTEPPPAQPINIKVDLTTPSTQSVQSRTVEIKRDVNGKMTGAKIIESEKGNHNGT